MTEPRRPAAALLLLAALALLAPAAGPQVSAAEAAPNRIPDVHATSFAGQHIDLPAQLQGRTGILVLGFSKDARNAARDWGRRLFADYNSSSTVSYFEMPVLAGVPRLLRGVVLHQIAADVSDPAKPHFVPITADEPRWRELAHYSAPDDAYVLIVDSNGLVRDTRSGPLTDASYAAIKRSVANLQPRPPAGSH